MLKEERGLKGVMQDYFKLKTKNINTAWKGFWENEKAGLLLYACLHGTVEMVEYFVNKLVSTYITKYIRESVDSLCRDGADARIA